MVDRSTTLKVYGHCVPGADRDAVDYIAELLTSRSLPQRTKDPERMGALCPSSVSALRSIFDELRAPIVMGCFQTSCQTVPIGAACSGRR
jgi:hypothetical protein